ncbi:MAG: FKBP-type peptidyl-prolyl cis-trans isomerase [Bacteroidetes bacterium]|nr:FKBP-type peptidyl-prolyl cis-trans isomerase [Bacteroidota bacterium]
MKTIIINKGRVLQYLIMFMIMGVLLPLGGCLKNNAEDLKKKEEEAIKDFVEKNDITVQPTESGLYYIETKEGDGHQPAEGDSVVINYIGTYLTGGVFDTNIDSVARANMIWNQYAIYSPFGFIIGNPNILSGWNEGITYMKEGGEATLLLPSSIAFHNYEPVLYEITLLEAVEQDSLLIK